MNRHHPYGGRENHRRGSSHWQGNIRPNADKIRGHTSSSLTVRSRAQAAESAPQSQTANIISSKVLDRYGQIQAHVICTDNGVWSIHSTTDTPDTFTVKFDDPSCRKILASKKPWECSEWNTPFRVNVLLELLYWVCGRVAKVYDLLNVDLLTLIKGIKAFSTRRL